MATTTRTFDRSTLRCSKCGGSESTTGCGMILSYSKRTGECSKPKAILLCTYCHSRGIRR